MNIHVIFTGGTIGSAISDKGIISARDSMAYALIDMYLEKYNNDCCFTVSSPYYILSENLSAENIRLLIKEVNTVLNNKDLSGVIIAHGTDIFSARQTFRLFLLQVIMSLPTRALTVCVILNMQLILSEKNMEPEYL